MDIERVSKKEHGKYPITFVSMTAREASHLIASLATQIASGNPNSGRYELFTESGEYFSIAVFTDEQMAFRKGHKG